MSKWGKPCKGGVGTEAIDKYLLENEEVQATVTVLEGTFYATNKRLLRYKKSFLRKRERVDSLSYSHITSVTLESKLDLLEGIIMIIVGGLILFFLAGFGLVFLIVGLAIIPCGIAMCFHRIAWYQIRATGLSEKDLSLWRISFVKEPRVRDFVRFLEQQIQRKNYESMTGK